MTMQVDFPFLNNIANIGIGYITLGTILPAVIVLILCLIGIKIIMRIVNRVLESSHLELGVKKFLVAIIKVLLYVLAGLMVADKLGIPVTSLVAVLSVVGVAVSLAIQGSLSNLAGGVMMLVTRPFVVGDYVEAGGVSGTVSEIGIAYTKIVTPDNKVISCPNSEISATKIINYTAANTRRVDINITVSYESNNEKVKAALLSCADKHRADMPEGQEPFVAVSAYKDSSIEYVVRVWVYTEKYWDTYFALLQEVKEEFDASGIEMTYPHMNVHVIEK